MGVSEDDTKTIAKGAKVRHEAAVVCCQRVEDNAFHLGSQPVRSNAFYLSANGALLSLAWGIAPGTRYR